MASELPPEGIVAHTTGDAATNDTEGDSSRRTRTSLVTLVSRRDVTGTASGVDGVRH
jgi:hypothetical protein